MKSVQQELVDKLSELAKACVEASMEDGVDLDTRLEVLKVAGAFALGAKKAGVKNQDDESNIVTFGNIKDRINGGKT